MAILILIGFMGTGKTAVGRRLAKQMEWDFFDVDPLIESETGMTIPQIFENKGEAAFRDVEEGLIMSIFRQAESSGRNTVMSLGGGAVVNRRVYERLMEEPLVFLLDEDLDTAFSRIKQGSRPLASNLEQFRLLFHQRDGLYKGVAKFVVDVRGRNADEVAGVVKGMLVEGEIAS